MRMRMLPRWLHALLLTLLALGAGGTSLSSDSVLLFHHHGEHSQATTHVEAPSCVSPLAHCGIGCPADAADALCPPIATPGLGIIESSALIHPFVIVPMPRVPRIGLHSRDPPHLHV